MQTFSICQQSTTNGSVIQETNSNLSFVPKLSKIYLDEFGIGHATLKLMVIAGQVTWICNSLLTQVNAGTSVSGRILLEANITHERILIKV